MAVATKSKAAGRKPAKFDVSALTDDVILSAVAEAVLEFAQDDHDANPDVYGSEDDQLEGSDLLAVYFGEITAGKVLHDIALRKGDVKMVDVLIRLSMPYDPLRGAYEAGQRHELELSKRLLKLARAEGTDDFAAYYFGDLL